MAKGKSFTRNTVGVSGLRELEANLLKLSKSAAKSTVKRLLLRAAAPMQEVASNLAPKLTGRLEEGTIVSSKKPKGYDKSKVAYSKVLRNGGDKKAALAAMRAARRENPQSFSQVFMGPTADLPQAMQQEMGNVKMPAQPYMRPAWDEKQGEAVHIIANDLGAEIDKTVARLARRALRVKK